MRIATNPLVTAIADRFATTQRATFSPSSGRSTAHADWMAPLHPAAWEGLPPEPWQSMSVPITEKSELITAASTVPGAPIPLASVV